MSHAHAALIIAAAVSFGLKAINVSTKIDLIALGFCLLTISLLV